jgi:hypothetical protein
MGTKRKRSGGERGSERADRSLQVVCRCVKQRRESTLTEKERGGRKVKEGVMCVGDVGVGGQMGGFVIIRPG